MAFKLPTDHIWTVNEELKLKEILDSLDNIKMYLKEDGLYALRVLYHYVDELKKEDPDILANYKECSTNENHKQ